MNKNNKNLTFERFFAKWALVNKWDVPAFHWQIVRYLDTYESWNNATGVLQVFRYGGKSSLVALFIIYMLVKNP